MSNALGIVHLFLKKCLVTPLSKYNNWKYPTLTPSRLLRCRALPGPNLTVQRIIDNAPNFDPRNICPYIRRIHFPCLPLSPSPHSTISISFSAMIPHAMRALAPCKRHQRLRPRSHHTARSISAWTVATTTTINEGDYDDDGDKREPPTTTSARGAFTRRVHVHACTTL